MGEPLVSAEAMNSLAAIFQDQMLTEVQIFSRATERNYLAWDDSSDTSEQFAETPVTVLGWLRERPDYQTDDDLSAIQHVEDARLHLPLGTVVGRGDKVVIGTEEYAVIDDNRFNTYKVSIRVALRRTS